MQVGGKRILTIPPAMAYGNKQTGNIPPNSTLIFGMVPSCSIRVRPDHLSVIAECKLLEIK
jgi:hypothetical protein